MTSGFAGLNAGIGFSQQLAVEQTRGNKAETKATDKLDVTMIGDKVSQSFARSRRKCPICSS